MQEGAEQSSDVWYYKTGSTSKGRKVIYSPAKTCIYEILYRGVTRHDLREMYFLVKPLFRCTGIDSYAMFRQVMILINSVGRDEIHKNLIIYLEKSLGRYGLSKPDVFVEFLTYLIKDGRIEDAQELFNLRHKYMSYQTHRKVLHNDVNIACYGLLMNYLSWQQRLTSLGDANFDVSIQGWLVNGINPLRDVHHNYEFFIMCLVNVLLFYGFLNKAYLLVSEFQRNNPDNLTGHLLLFRLIKRLTESRSRGTRRSIASRGSRADEQEKAREEHRLVELSAINNFSNAGTSEPFDIDNYPVSSDNTSILSNLMRLDMGREEIIELSSTHLSKIETIQVVMDSLMEVSSMRDASRWLRLQTLLDEIYESGDSTLLNSLASLWQTRYQEYWRLKDFLRLIRDGVDSPNERPSHTSVVKRVIRTLKSSFDRELEGDPDNSMPESEACPYRF